MFRISHTRLGRVETITLEGTVAGADVSSLEALCEHLHSTKRTVIFLQDVCRIDDCARALLCRVVQNGIELRGVGIYERYLARRINTEARERREARSGVTHSIRGDVGPSAGWCGM